MNNLEEHRFIFETQDEEGKMLLKGEITGESQMEQFDDLKLKGVVALLNAVDQDSFIQSNKQAVFQEYINEIQETLAAIQTHGHFQGEIINREH